MSMGLSSIQMLLTVYLGADAGTQRGEWFVQRVLYSSVVRGPHEKLFVVAFKPRLPAVQRRR